MTLEAEAQPETDIFQKAMSLAKENLRLTHERELAEEQLLQANRQRALILNSVGEGIYGLDLEGNITFANPAAEKMLGYTEEELLGKSQHDLIHHSKPNGSPYPQKGCHICAAFKNATAYRESKEVFWRKVGICFPVEFASTPIHENEKLIGAVVTFNDITERKKAEQTLRDSETRANAVLNHVLNGIITIDEQGIIETFNPAAEKIFGYKVSEIMGENITCLIPESLRNGHEQGLKNYLDSGITKVIGVGAEVTGLRKDGSTFPMDLGINEMHIGETRMFTGIIRDITERKKAEQALWESETRSKEVLDYAACGIITIDEQGIIESFNPAAEYLFSYQAADVLGTNIKLLMPEPFQSEHDQYLKRYLETGVSKIIGIRREAVGLREDGTTFPLDLGITEMYMGETRKFTGIVRDISALKQAEAQNHLQYELTRIFLAGNSLDDTFPKILQTIGEFMEWEISHYWEKNQESEELYCRYAWNADCLKENEALKEFKKISFNKTFKKGTGLPGRVWEKLEPSWIPDVRCDKNFPRAPFAKNLGMKAGFGFPVFSKNQFLGVIEVFTRRLCLPDTQHIQLLTHLGGQIGQWMRLKKAEEHLKKLNLTPPD